MAVQGDAERSFPCGACLPEKAVRMLEFWLSAFVTAKSIGLNYEFSA
jgi:hypothetical protein